VSWVIDRLGLEDDFGDRGAARLTEELEVDAIVKGSFDRRGRKMKFVIYAGGKKAKPFTVDVVDAGSDKFQRLVRMTVLAKLAIAMEATPDADDDDPPTLDGKGKKSGAKTAKNKTKKEGDSEVPAGPVTSPDDSAKKKLKAKDASSAGDVATADDGKKTAKAKEEPAADDGAKKQTKPAGDAASGDDPADPAPGGKRGGKQVASSDARDGGSNDDVTTVRAEAGSQSRVTNPALAAARASLGVSVLARSLSFQSTAATAPKGFSSGAVAGGRFEGEIYPLAVAESRGPLAALGVYGEIEQALALKMRSPTLGGSAMTTTDRHYSVGLRYRFAFGTTPTSPALTVGVGYGARTYSVDRSSLATPGALAMPDVDYRVFDPGVMFRMPVGSMFAVTLAGRGFLATTAGPIQNQDQYGTTKVLGGTASAGFEIMAMRNRIAIRVAGELTQLNLDFEGNGLLSTGGQAKSASDRYLGGNATVGVLY
jgi:hypothetical protein